MSEDRLGAWVLGVMALAASVVATATVVVVVVSVLRWLGVAI